MNTPDDEQDGFLARFPALERLRAFTGGPRIPFVQQLTETECGAACLTMVLGYFGKAVRLEDVRVIAGVDRNGANALALLEAARWYGLRSRGVKVEVEELQYLEPGTVLHWEFRHFVVFERLAPGVVHLVDPAVGRRAVPLEQFRRSFTGVALLLEPSESFEPSEPGAHPARRYFQQLRRHTGLLGRVVVTSVLVQLFALGVPVLTGAVVDQVVPRGDWHLLTVLCAGMAALVAFNFLTTLVRSYLLLHLRTHLDARMTLGFLDHLMDLPYAYFQVRPAGDLLQRMNSNTTVREILTSGALSGLLDGSLVSFYLLILLVAHAPLGLLVLGLGFLQVAVFLATRKRLRELMAQGLQAEARSAAYQVELLTGIETLKAMGVERQAVDRWSGFFADMLNVSLDRGRLSALTDALNGTLRMLSPLVILAFGASQVLSGHMSLGTMLGLSALATGFLGPLATLLGTASQLQLLGTYVERLDDVLGAAPEQEPESARPSPPLNGDIALEDVSFRYSPLTPLVVSNVSVRIQRGQLVAIVGRSGAGKSTLAHLLLGLYLPTSGRIGFDGHDLREMDLRSVRRQMGIVPQNPVLFGGSIRSNIALSQPDTPLPVVMEAAKLAQIHDEIAQMPMAYETALVDRGGSLSGGQRQRIALARALLSKPAILLLDEATSALDAVTEARVQQALSELKCTRVVIAHRLSTVVSADLILVMDEGRVVESGTHAELLARGGAYAALVAGQLSSAA